MTVRTRSSTADFATSSECADRIPLMAPYANPRRSRTRGLPDMLVILVKSPAITMTATTKIAWHIIHVTKGPRPRRNSSWSRLWAGSGIAPKIAMSTAPVDTNSVPPKDQRVNGSPRIREAQIELKTRPEACRVDSTGKGRVVICMVLPTKLDITNIPIPSCHRRRLYGGRRPSWSSFSSSKMWDLR